MKINKGDYIDSREFSREECERFCELAVECGFPNPYNSGLEYRYAVADNTSGLVNSVGEISLRECGRTNITQQFREFLDKEKGKVFTKSDLKDGMRVIHADGTETIVVGDAFWVTRSDNFKRLTNHTGFASFSHNLDYIGIHPHFAVIKVTDRDGTVLFEREEEPRELTIEEIAAKFGLPVERVRIKK